MGRAETGENIYYRVFIKKRGFLLQAKKPQKQEENLFSSSD